MSKPSNQEYFEFLDDMREFGGVNMFAAQKMLRESFDLDRQEAAKIFKDWTDQWS